MKRILDFDMAKCSACGACMIACMDQNDIHAENKQTPFRTCYDLQLNVGINAKFAYLSVACMHCNDAPCITGCPTGCLYKDPDTNLTLFDNTNCIGCHSCAMTCPIGAPTFGPEGKMVKCDGCAERIKYGYEPACTLICPTGALHSYTKAEYEDVLQQRALKIALTRAQDPSVLDTNYMTPKLNGNKL